MALKIVLLAVLALAIIGGGILALRLISGGEDTWLCQNGEWVKHGNPKASKPTEPCGKSAEEPAPAAETRGSEAIRVTSPQPNEVVVSPLEIIGEVRGTWYFEAVFPIRLLDENGQEIGQAIAEAQEDWMTEDFVPFKAKLDFKVVGETKANLILARDNPSGLPENAAEISIPVRLKPAEDNFSNDFSWITILEGQEDYTLLKGKEEIFYGQLTYEECPEVSILMRCTPYKLNGISVYLGSQELKDYVGKEVEIIGKKHSFALEGEYLTEIWAAKIRAWEK